MEMLVESEQKWLYSKHGVERMPCKSVEVESVHGTQITIVNETLESRKSDVKKAKRSDCIRMKERDRDEI